MPKIMGASLDEHREQTRQRVFEAFTRLMAQNSYDSITLAEIAAEAGIGRTALYNHFRDKEAVVVAFASAETDRYVGKLDHVLVDVDGPTDALRTYIRQHIAMSDEFHFGFGTELYGALSRTALMKIRDHVVAVENVVRRILDEGNAAGDFDVSDVDAAVALIHACLQPRHVSPRAVEDFVLRAIRP